MNDTTTSPVFALSRTDYYHERSYADYLSLVTLSGYSTCFFDEMDIRNPSRCYILSPYDPDWGGFPGARARLIWYDLEWHTQTPFPDVPGISEVWVADAWYAKRTGKKYVPLGSHPGLKLDIGSVGGKQYDVVMLSYMTDRRKRIADGLKANGVSISPQGWGAQRHAVLMQSRIMLHVHQRDDARTAAPQRFALAAAYKLPLVSESLDDGGIFGREHVITFPYQQLITGAQDELRIEHTQGETLHQLLCVEKTFRKNIEAAL